MVGEFPGVLPNGGTVVKRSPLHQGSRLMVADDIIYFTALDHVSVYKVPFGT